VATINGVSVLTFDAKRGTLGGLADAGEHVELQVGTEGLRQADGGGALALPQGGGGDAGGRERNKPREETPIN